MNELQIFHYQSKDLRTSLKDGAPWWVAKDVCEILEIKNSRDAISRLDEDEKGVVLTDTPGGIQELQAVNESGLYNLVLSSRKPEAKTFKRWITHKVIPQIRKTGTYSTQRELPKVDISIRIAESIFKELRLPDSGKLTVYSKICKEHGVSDAILPAYADEKITKSLTDLLAQFEVGIRASEANQILLNAGILELKTRSSKSKGAITFKSLTEEGLKFGKNLISPANPRETQPHYYEDAFDGIIAILKGG